MNKLKSSRKASGISVSELSYTTGVSKSLIYKMESEEGVENLETYVRLMKALGEEVVMDCEGCANHTPYMCEILVGRILKDCPFRMTLKEKRKAESACILYNATKKPN